MTRSHLRKAGLAGILALAGTALTVACSAAFVTPDVTPQLAAAYADRYPDAASGDLERGRELFASSCGRGGFCHKLPNPASRRDDQWPSIMTRMASKAALDGTQERDVLRFILAVRAQ